MHCFSYLALVAFFIIKLACFVKVGVAMVSELVLDVKVIPKDSYFAVDGVRVRFVGFRQIRVSVCVDSYSA